MNVPLNFLQSFVLRIVITVFLSFNVKQVLILQYVMVLNWDRYQRSLAPLLVSEKEVILLDIGKA